MRWWLPFGVAAACQCLAVCRAPLPALLAAAAAAKRTLLPRPTLAPPHLQDGSLIALTKGVEHPAAPRLPGVVRMQGFHSHWRSRTVACPLGSGRPACETTLLHYEDFQIPERLAR